MGTDHRSAISSGRMTTNQNGKQTAGSLHSPSRIESGFKLCGAYVVANSSFLVNHLERLSVFDSLTTRAGDISVPLFVVSTIGSYHKKCQQQTYGFGGH